VQFPSEPWEKLDIDVVGPFVTAAWDCHLALTLTEFSGLNKPSQSATAANVITFLTSAFSMFHHITQHIRTSVYRRAANGAVERFHRIYKSCCPTREAVEENSHGIPQFTVLVHMPPPDCLCLSYYTEEKCAYALTGTCTDIWRGYCSNLEKGPPHAPPCYNLQIHPHPTPKPDTESSKL